MPTPESFSRLMTSLKVSALARSTIAEPPARSVILTSPSMPNPLPPPRLDNNGLLRSPIIRWPVILSPTAGFVSPRSVASVPPAGLSTEKVPLPAVRSVSTNRLPSLLIAACSRAGSAVLSASSSSPTVRNVSFCKSICSELPSRS